MKLGKRAREGISATEEGVHNITNLSSTRSRQRDKSKSRYVTKRVLSMRYKDDK